MLKNIYTLLYGIICSIYLLNPTAGFFELIPDTIPIIGNIDEILATTLLLKCLSHFGINFFGSKDKKKDNDAPLTLPKE